MRGQIFFLYGVFLLLFYSTFVLIFVSPLKTHFFSVFTFPNSHPSSLGVNGICMVSVALSENTSRPVVSIFFVFPYVSYLFIGGV